jgi:hypothetical protein
MTAFGQHSSLVSNNKAGRAVVRANCAGNTLGSNPFNPAWERPSQPDDACLFQHAAAARVALPEHFPRLTIAMITAALLAFSATAEIDCLQKAGCHWSSICSLPTFSAGISRVEISH